MNKKNIVTKKNIEKVADFLKENSNISVKVEGHTFEFKVRNF